MLKEQESQFHKQRSSLSKNMLNLPGASSSFNLKRLSYGTSQSMSMIGS